MSVLHIVEKLTEALQARSLLGESSLPTDVDRKLTESAALALAYFRTNPPWKDRTLLWFCHGCAENPVTPPLARVGKKWLADRGPRGCDLCGRDPVDAAELEAIVVDLK